MPIIFITAMVHRLKEASAEIYDMVPYGETYTRMEFPTEVLVVVNCF